MAEVALSRNFKLSHGKVGPKPACKRLRDFNVYRWNAEYGKNPQVALQAVTLCTGNITRGVRKN